jgi:tRNA(Ile)-lysidine synthase
MIVARVRRTLLERALVAPGTRVLAACSGGPDSAAMLVALARLCSALGFELEAASVDHGLRPGAADDVEVAAEQAAKAGVAFHRLRVDVVRTGSLQANARVARYAALHDLASRRGAARIAVGHTLEDQAETVLMRLLRGAGVAGLSGIEPLRGDGVIRPLIDCRRADVAAFAAQHCARLARDPSNDDPGYERVRMRRELMPALLREDPALVEHLASLAEDAREQLAALAPAAEAVREAALQQDGSIDLSSLARAPRAIQTLALRGWLAQSTGLDPARAHLEQLAHASASDIEVWLPEGWVARSRAGRLFLTRSTGG